MVNSFIAKKDLDSEMTVVRNEFEAGENDPDAVLARARPLDRLPLAQLRQETRSARARTSRTSRSSGCRRSGGTTTSRTTRTCSWPGGSTKRRRWRRSTRSSAPIPRPKRALPREPTRPSRRRTASAGDARARRRRPGVAVAYHVPSGPHPDSAAVDVARLRCWPTRRPAGSTRRWSRRRRRRRSPTSSSSSTTRAS